MKILSFRAENIKKLKVVDLTPQQHFNEITGANGSGKSTLLDCIRWAFGGKAAIQDNPIRSGQSKAKIVLGVGTNRVEFVVERVFTGTGTALEIESIETGKPYTSPQAFLDTIQGHLAFDPFQFAKLKKKEQHDMLCRVSGIKLDFAALAEADKADYEERRVINRDVKSLEAELKALQVPWDAPEEMMDTDALLKAFQEVNAHNRQVEQAERDRKSLETERKRIESEISRLKRQLASVDRQLAELPTLEPRDSGEIEEKLAHAKQHNEEVSLRNRANHIQEQLDGKTQQAERLTGRMKDREQQRVDALRSAKMPVPGLSLAGDEVFYNDLPFEQASTAEQIRVSVGVAMEVNADLRVLIIKDGGLLDARSKKILEEMTVGGDYQCWIEEPDTTGKIGVYIEDGTVAANNYEEEEEEAGAK